MAELTVKAKASSVTLSKTLASSYADTHDAASGTVDTSAAQIRVGQYYNSGGVLKWAVIRGALLFDAPTAGLPSDAVISSAQISLYGEVIRNTQSLAFNIVVVSGADLADPVVATDYGDLLDDTVSRGLIAVGDVVTGAYNDITLDATGISEISKTGITKFALRSSRDISSTAPASAHDLEEVAFTWAPPGLEPLLVITYTGAALAIVTTQPVTNLVTSTGIGNGDITFLGSPAATQHGHCWNITGLPTITEPVAHAASGGRTENGVPSATGAFTSSLTELVPGNIYYIRAYATNSGDTSYGEQVTFVAGAPGVGSDLAGIIRVVEERLDYVSAYGKQRWLKGIEVE